MDWKSSDIRTVLSAAFLVLGLASTTFPWADARASTLASVPIHVGLADDYPGGMYSSIYFGLALSQQDQTTLNGSYLFQETVTLADVGRTYTLESGPGFGEAVARLTDGRDDWLVYEADWYGVIGALRESSWLHPNGTGVNGPDLAGSDIRKFLLHVNSVELYYDPGLISFISVLDATFTVLGTPPVPEPRTSALLGMGLLGMIAVLRRRARRR